MLHFLRLLVLRLQGGILLRGYFLQLLERVLGGIRGDLLDLVVVGIHAVLGQRVESLFQVGQLGYMLAGRLGLFPRDVPDHFLHLRRILVRFLGERVPSRGPFVKTRAMSRAGIR